MPPDRTTQCEAGRTWTLTDAELQMKHRTDRNMIKLRQLCILIIPSHLRYLRKSSHRFTLWSCFSFLCVVNIMLISFALFPLDPADEEIMSTKDGCKMCPEGSFASSGACDLCSPGTFSDAPGATACTPCGLGNYTQLRGSVRCFQCSEGPGWPRNMVSFFVLHHVQ